MTKNDKLQKLRSLQMEIQRQMVRAALKRALAKTTPYPLSPSVPNASAAIVDLFDGKIDAQRAAVDPP